MVLGPCAEISQGGVCGQYHGPSQNSPGTSTPQVQHQQGPSIEQCAACMSQYCLRIIYVQFTIPEKKPMCFHKYTSSLAQRQCLDLDCSGLSGCRSWSRNFGPVINPGSSLLLKLHVRLFIKLVYIYTILTTRCVPFVGTRGD